MMKKIVAFLLIVSSLLCFSGISYAAEADVLECSNITFVDASGNPVTALSGEQITAKVTVKNGGVSAAKPTLMVCSYQNNKLNGVWYKAADSAIAQGASAEISVAFTPVTTDENTVIEATIVDSLLKLNAPVAMAKMLESSTDLDGISVGGQYIADYTNEQDEYMVKLSGSDAKVIAQAKDGGTKIEVTQPESIPGNADVKITAADGTERNVALVVYEEDEQLYSLTKLGYMVDGVEYEVENFDPKVTEYTINLPDNTFYVTVAPEALSVADMTVNVSDINHMGKTFDGVSYFLGTSYVHRSGERPAFDNVIPIKNEETNAVISVTDGENAKKYTLTFTSKQPRLTEFKLGDGSYQETEKPFFISGAAANNDNGTAVGADRNVWTLGGFTGPLLGGSMISLSSITSARNASSWQSLNKSGEWCSFKADTPGTIYMMCTMGISNKDYYNEENGWVAVSNAGLSFSAPKNGQSLKINETSEAYYFANIQWSDSAESYTAEGVLNPSKISGPMGYGNVVKKTFDKGELVSIHHPGATSAGGCAEAIIIWDLPQE